MEQDTVKNIVEQYRQIYARSNMTWPNRLPQALRSEEDIRNRLTAIYSLEVESRNREFILDSNTIEKIDLVSKWLFCSEKRGLLLMGTMGNGKTTMLSSIRRLFECKTALVNAIDLYDSYKENQGLVPRRNEVLLLIDDLGIEPIRCLIYGEEHYPLSKLFLYRYDRRLTTVIATNLDEEQIKERYGDRVMDRMIETFEVIIYDAGSYRQQ